MHHLMEAQVPENIVVCYLLSAVDMTEAVPVRPVEVSSIYGTVPSSLNVISLTQTLLLKPLPQTREPLW